MVYPHQGSFLSAESLLVGADDSTHSSNPSIRWFFNGDIDEVRISTSARAPCPSATGTLLDPVAHWSYDGDLLDSSDGAHDGSDGGVAYDSGPVGQCVLYEGDSWVSVPALDDVAIDAELTVAFWARLDDDPTGPGAPFVRWADPTEDDAGWWAALDPLADENVLFSVNGPSSSGEGLGPANPESTWGHYSFTYSDAEGVAMYIDDALYDSDPSWTSGLTASAAADLYFGGHPTDAWGGLNACVDDLWLFDRPLNELELSVLSAAGLQDADGDGWFEDLDCDDEDPLVGLCPLGETARSVAEADITLLGQGAGHLTGYILDVPGDLTGDGVDDLLVAGHNTGSSGGPGMVYLLPGGALTSGSIDTRAITTYIGAAAGDRLGWELKSGPDVTGDGVPDFIITASDASSYMGEHFLISGAAAGAGLGTLTPGAGAVAAWTCDGGGRGGRADFGDIDGDGETDILLGCHQNSQAGTQAGKFFVLLGDGTFNWISGGLELVADHSVLGDPPHRGLGRDLNLADFDADGDADLIVGAQNLSGASVTGYYLPGGAWGWDTPVVNLGVQIDPTADGYCTGPAGDLNGDGYLDLVVGVGLDSSADVDAGAVYVVHGPPSNFLAGSISAIADVVWTGTAAQELGDGNSTSCAMATADLTGDGVDDLLIGAEGEGAVYLFPGDDAGLVSGPASSASTASYHGMTPSDNANRMAVGDLDGDGTDDLVIGAPMNDDGGSAAGAVYIFLSD